MKQNHTDVILPWIRRQRPSMPNPSISTAPGRVTYREIGRARLVRRLYMGLVGGFLVLGMLNVFGSKTATVSASSNGYTLRVTYPAATRSSLPVKWDLVLTHRGGFSGSIRIAIPIEYFNLFDFNNFYPIPDSTLNEGGLVLMDFPAPDGDTLEVLLDARTQAGLRAGLGTTTTVLDSQDRSLVQVSYSTRVVP
jgi:hypothetical protein